MFTKLLNRFKFLHFELAGDFQKLEKEFKSEWDQKLSTASDDIEHRYKLWTSRVSHWINQSNILFALTAPFIYALWIPALIMDAFITVYQKICFPVYGIPLVERNDHIAIDRHRLPYLKKLEKFNCLFCGYFNGVVSYVGEIAARTEQYWCPIKHARKLNSTHGHYEKFFDYGDGKSYRQGLNKLRKKY